MNRHAEKIAVRTPMAETARRASVQPVGRGKLTTNRSDGAFAANGMRAISSAWSHRTNLILWASGEPKPSQVRRLSANAVRSISVNSRQADAQNRLSVDEKRTTLGHFTILSNTSDNATLSDIFMHRQGVRLSSILLAETAHQIYTPAHGFARALCSNRPRLVAPSSGLGATAWSRHHRGRRRLRRGYCIEIPR